VQGSGFRVQGSGCRVQGAGCRVQGLKRSVRGSYPRGGIHCGAVEAEGAGCVVGLPVPVRAKG
jgi:hypothetical protein